MTLVFMRKKLVIVILALLTAGVGFAWLSSARKSGMPKLAIAFSHYETNHGAVFGVVRITNSGTCAAAYASGSFGLDSPLYNVLTHSPTGWANATPGICGTEIHPRILPPGTHMTAQVYLRTNQTWKVGIVYSDARVGDRVASFAPRLWRRWLWRYSPATPPTYAVWSEPIAYDQKR